MRGDEGRRGETRADAGRRERRREGRSHLQPVGRQHHLHVVRDAVANMASDVGEHMPQVLVVHLRVAKGKWDDGQITLERPVGLEERRRALEAILCEEEKQALRLRDAVV